MNVLLIDDHPMTISGFTDALQKERFSEFAPIFTNALSCEEAYHAIYKAFETNKPFDLAIIDLGLPAFVSKMVYSGSDLAVIIRDTMPHCKIIMMTAHTEIIIIYDIAKKVRPEGFIIKTDITPTSLHEAVKTVIDGEKFQSPTVKKCIEEIWKKELMVEDNNRMILMYMSKGFKIKELEKVINLTTSAIQKRVVRMKKVFDVSDEDGLVKEAKLQGYI